MKASRLRRRCSRSRNSRSWTPDERQFLDMDGTVILLMSQHLVYQRPAAPIHGGIKLFELPVRRRDMSRSKCQQYWRETHGPLVLGATDMIKPLRRYVQSHSLADGIGGLPPMHYDGMAELWFDNAEDLEACFGRQYMDVVHPDERYQRNDDHGTSRLVIVTRRRRSSPSADAARKIMAPVTICWS